ncbi:Aste57867_18638 [Aphanomyces stellatus]|uniref:Aste57867_18638 protein n=1 Tax=Aphanomyces stellatus TaxID=120398 RepID=A0A485LB87_9STRA|nr:hypothetical protein As57867_018576 [Aphanomyces stellatus]VFT95373.1 Aste57867_18638 [Aphanomyces stellatus]
MYRPRVAPRVSAYESLPSVTYDPQPKALRFYGEVALGYLYLLVTLGCSFYYMHVLTPYLANDLWWPNFNKSGGQSFLIDLINAQLASSHTLNSTSSWDLSTATLTKDYSSTSTSIMLQSAYGRRVMLEDTNLDRAIARLRQMMVSDIEALPTQYCWVDFDRRWGLAHTTKRQARCRAHDMDNAAVYLEAPLRLVYWKQWDLRVGPLFRSAIVADLRPIDQGQAWVQALDTMDGVRDMATESAAWRAKGLTRFTLQWQNLVQPWLDESVVVTTAVSSHLTLVKRLAAATRTTEWTSQVFYWGTLRDWQHAAYVATRFNASLVTVLGGGSARPSIQTIDPDMLYPISLDNSLSIQAVRTLLRHVLGPFLTIDMRYVMPPPELVAYFKDFQTRAHVVVTSQPATTVQLDPMPPTWSNASYRYFGGNPLCGAASQLPPEGYQLSFGFDDTCTRVLDYVTAIDQLGLVFIVSSATVQDDSIAACALCNQTRAACVEAMLTTTQLIASLQLPPRKDLLWAQAKAAVRNIQVVQMVLVDTAPILLRQHLVDDDAALSPSFDVFGWGLLYGWLIGNREVVTFEGDDGSLTLVSKRYALVPFDANEGDIPRSMGFYLWFIAMYISVALTIVAAVALVYGLFARCSLLGRNLFRFNRVAGCVWVGRPMLMARGLTALVLLSSAHVELQSLDGVSALVTQKRSWFDSLVITGEASWALYVLHDMLVVCSNQSYLIAPLASILAWLVTLLLDVVAPYEISATMTRDCHAVAFGLSCTVGEIRLGNFERLVAILGIYIGSTLVAAVAVRVWNWLTNAPLFPPFMASLLLPAPSDAFLDVAAQPRVDVQSIDAVSCILSGLLPIQKPRATGVFDIKLWVFVACDIKCHMVHLARPMFLPVNMQSPRQHHANVAAVDVPRVVYRPGRAVQPLHGPTLDVVDLYARARPWIFRLKVAASFVYMLGTVASSVSFVSFSSSSVSNDLYWVGFNSSGMHSYLGNWFNAKQLVGTGRSDPFDDVDVFDVLSYNRTDVTIQVPVTVASLAQQNSDVVAVIRGLRTTSGADALRLSTRYCWLDFDKRWDMAGTAARQQRCGANESANGAVFLESILRNVAWQTWGRCLLASVPCLAAFAVAFEADVTRTSSGRAWWASLAANSNSLSDEDEAAYWATHGATRFTLQWQNFKTIGIVDAFDVVNAMGMNYAFSLKYSNGTSREALQTSFKAQQPLHYDLAWLVATNASVSLIRTSAAFAFANVSAATSLPWPLAPHAALVEDTLGPFGSIDLRHIACPTTLIQLYQRIANYAVALAQANTPLFGQFYAIQSATWSVPTPGRWNSTWWRGGGDILCPEAVVATPLPGCLFDAFGLTKGCSAASTRMVLTVDRSMLLFAATVWLDRHPTTPLNATFLCGAHGTDHQCAAALMTIATVAKGCNGSTLSVQNIQALNVSLIQFTTTSTTTTTSNAALVQIPLFDVTEPQFEFFAWCLMHDWIVGRRDVVAFEGDVGALTLVSAKSPLQVWRASPSEIPTNIVPYIRGGMIYITTMLAVVATVVLLFTLDSLGHIEPRNMLLFSRVAGLVWVGRPLLLGRGLVAVSLLSTAKVDLVRHGRLNFLQSPTVDLLAYAKMILSSSEACWIVYVLQDLATVCTNERTSRYSGRAALVTWVLSAILSCCFPVHPIVTLDHTCDLITVDWQLECTSGSVAIGDFTRFRLLVVIAVASVVGFLGLVICRPQQGVTLRAPSLFLTSGAKLRFKNRHKWFFRGVHYLDKASAVMNGLLITTWHSRFYVFDIKTWRVFIVPMPLFPKDSHAVPHRFRYAFPLTE